jgi:nitrilase
MMKPLGGNQKIRVAIAQAAPVYYDKEKTVDKARKLISEAAGQGARMIVFPETWISGYPYWILPAQGSSFDPKLYARALTMLQDSSIQIPSEDTERLCDSARRHRIHVVMGSNELSDVPGSRTVFNSLLYIDDEGRFLGRHRKLMPTNEERLVWGMGDGSDLHVYETKIGRLGGLVCWENHMILVRAAMVMKGEEIHVAVWPGHWRFEGANFGSEISNGQDCDLYPAIREHAFESGAFVVSAVSAVRPEDVPTEFPYGQAMAPSLGIANGGSAIVGPSGNYIAGPTFGHEQIIAADCDVDLIKVAKAFFDSIGHYARFDVARLDLKEDGWSPFSKNSLGLNRRLTQSDLRKLAQKYDIESDKLERAYEEISS